jgi:hypothetical protein
MKTIDANSTQWRRIGKSKPRCIVVGANNGQGKFAAGSVASNKVRPLMTYPQVCDYRDDEDNDFQDGDYLTPPVESFRTAREYMEVAVPADIPDVKSITGFERDPDVKDMDTSTITANQSKTTKYATITRPANEIPVKEAARPTAETRRRGRDLHGGMELLGIDFLLDMVENIDGTEEYDIAMRKLSIHELMRTSRIGEVDSNVLKFYCLDSDGLYGREIQCEAMKELSRRTRQHTPA